MIALILSAIVLFFALVVALGALWGAPFLPILRRDLATFWELSDLQAGQSVLDLGSGDGRLLREAARRGIYAIGYEINPILYLVSMVVCWRYRRLVTIHLGDYWRIKLPQVSVIYVFLIGRFMTRLETKLTLEVTGPTILISHAFELPNRSPDATAGASFRYNLP